MAEPTRVRKKRTFFFLKPRFLRAVVIILAVAILSWLAAWLTERSLRVPAKKRAMQSWMDENLNADVSLLGDMTVRLNLLRRSRLLFHNVEIEHPNPLFPGKFAVISRMGAWIKPWSMTRLVPDELDLQLRGLRLSVAENESGEWSTDGLMRPLVTTDVQFPFPIPRVSRWRARIRDSVISVRRQEYELRLDMSTELFGRPGNPRIDILAGRTPFTFGLAESDERQAGVADAIEFRVSQEGDRDRLPKPVAGRCSVRVTDLPVAILPFLVRGIPMDYGAGLFSGLIRYDAHDQAAGALAVEGELHGAPLAVFGLPRNAPLRLHWPLAPDRDGLEASVHLGPSGFGGFALKVPLDARGNPTRLIMRGDVASLDDIPQYFTRLSSWPAWLTRAFPALEWHSGEWRGFGWNGTNLALSLVRSTAGLNLTGEAEMLGGRVRIAMTPDQHNAPIIVAAERLDPQQLVTRLCRDVPEPFRAQLTGAHVNLTWRGHPDDAGELQEWGGGLVFAKPVVDLAASGSWWRGLHDIARAITHDLPSWGGGDPGPIDALNDLTAIELDQLSIVLEREDNGYMAVEFRAYGEAVGQATGLIERHVDGAVEGEFLLAGSSALIEAVRAANPAFAQALEMLANDTPGLRVIFRAEAGGEPVFAYPFLHDARMIREELRRAREAEE